MSASLTPLTFFSSIRSRAGFASCEMPRPLAAASVIVDEVPAPAPCRSAQTPCRRSPGGSSPSRSRPGRRPEISVIVPRTGSPAIRLPRRSPPPPSRRRRLPARASATARRSASADPAPKSPPPGFISTGVGVGGRAGPSSMLVPSLGGVPVGTTPLSPTTTSVSPISVPSLHGRLAGGGAEPVDAVGSFAVAIGVTEISHPVGTLPSTS